MITEFGKLLGPCLLFVILIIPALCLDPFHFPEQKFDVDNGITLCQKCHSHFHNDYKSSTRAKCTKHDMDEYQKLAEYFMERAIFLTFTALEKEGNLNL